MADRNPILSSVSDPAVQFNTDSLAQKDQEAAVAIDATASDVTKVSSNVSGIISGTQAVSPDSHFHVEMLTPKWPAGKWISIFRGYSSTSSNFVNNATNRGNIHWCLVVLPNGAKVDQLAVAVAVTNATTNVRLGLYDDLDGVPNTLLVDAGTVSLATGGTKTANIGPLTLKKGRYWLAVCMQSAATTTGAINGWTCAYGPPMYKYADSAVSALGSGAINPTFFTISNAYTSAALPASAAGLPYVDTGGTALAYGPSVTMRTA
jgi:hypothetical protein